MVNYCDSCGNSVTSSAKFCNNCGAPIIQKRRNDQQISNFSPKKRTQSQPLQHLASQPPPTSPPPPPPPPTSPPSSPPIHAPPSPYGWDYSPHYQPYYTHYPYNYFQHYQYYQPPGYYYYPPQVLPKTDLRRIFAGIVVLPSYVFLGIILIINLITLLIGINIVFPELYSNTAFIVIPYPWPNFILPIEISGSFSIFWFSFVIVCIVLSVIWLFKSEGKGFSKIFLDSIKKINPPPSKSKNAFIIIAQCFLALWFFNIIIVLFLSLFGMPADSPVNGEEAANWEIFYALANASVAEEIFTRILYIGLPLLIVDYLIRKKPKKIHKYFLGGDFEMDNITVILIVFSSLTFGFAHLPSWGLWKVIPTTAAGLALGYLFTKKGLYASIILHFLVNYMGIIIVLFEDNIAVLVILASVLGIMMVAWFFSGILYFGVYLNEFYDYLTIKLYGADYNAVPVDQYYSDVNYVKVTSQKQNQLNSEEPIEIVWRTDSRGRRINEPPTWPQNSSDQRSTTDRSGYGEEELQRYRDTAERFHSRYCPWCSSKLVYYRENGYWFCNWCNRYVI